MRTSRHPRTWVLPLSVAVFTAACNQAPNPPDVTILPESPTTVDDLVAEVTGTDPDEDKLTYTFTWSRDGEVVAGLTTDTVPAAETAKGETWTVEVVPNDGVADGPAGSASTDILNTAPSLTVALTPDPATTEDDLVGEATTEDIDGDTVTVTYTWMRDDSATTVTGDTVPAAETTRGETWTVTAVPSDGEIDGASATDSITLGNALPTVVTLTFDPAVAYADGPITAVSTTFDGDDDPVTLTWDWTVNGTAAGDGTDTLAVGEFVAGDVIEVTLVPNDGVADGPAFTSSPLVVANAVPVITGVSVLPAPAYEASVLTCTPAGWYDGDGDAEAYVWSWAVNGSTIAATSQTLTGASFNRGDAVTCTAVPDDGTDLGTPLTSAALTIQNTPPVLASAALSDLSPLTTETLSVVLGAASDDDPADAASIAYRYAWYVDGTLAGTNPTLPPSAFAKDDLVYAIVTPYDPQGDGLPVTTASALVGNTAPVTSAVVISPSTAYTTDDLVATPTSADDDGDSLTHSYTWFINGTAIGGVTGNTLPAELHVKGDSVRVMAIAHDGFADGISASSSAVVIRNSAPTLTGAAILPETITEADTATCTPLGWADADGDPESYTYAWTINGQPASNGPTLDGEDFDKDDVIACTVTPSDGDDDGAAATADAVTVANTPPTIATVSINQPTPREGDTLTLTVNGIDDIDPADAGQLSPRFEWRVNGTAVSSGSTLSSALYFDKGDVVVVEVFASDPDDEGAGVTSAPVTILNTPPVVQSVTLAPQPAYTDSTLEASAVVVDVDGDTFTLVYDWRVEGQAALSGDTIGSLDSSYFVKGEQVYVIVTATDDEASSLAVNSSALVISNTAPYAPELAIEPMFPMAGQDELRCVVAEESDDLDGDILTYEVRWLRDGVPYEAGDDLLGPTSTVWPGDTVPAEDTADGVQWTCEVIPADFEDEGDHAMVDITTYTLDFRSLAAGGDFTCGLATDRTTTCWGHNVLMGASAPVLEASEVATSLNASCAIDLDGNLSCWGGDLPQILATPSGTFHGVQVGGVHGCAIDETDTAVCWGINISGATTAPTDVAMVELDAGFAHACGVTDTGFLRCWGDGSAGQRLLQSSANWAHVAAGYQFTCGIRTNGFIDCSGDPANIVSDAPEGAFRSISAGGVHACAVDHDNQITCWGDPSIDLTPPPGEYAEVSAGAFHTCARTVEGDTVCWGESSWGQLTPPTAEYEYLATGRQHTCGIDDDYSVTCWGLNDDGQCDVPELPAWAYDVSAGEFHTCALLEDASVVCWGSDNFDQLNVPDGLVALQIDAGRLANCAIDATGAIVCWGDDTWGLVSDVPPGFDWITVSVDEHHACAIDLDRNVVCWGTNLNDETVPPGDLMEDVSVGEDHSCGVTTDHELRCWGNDSLDQSTPPVGDDFLNVVAGRQHSCARKDDFSVVCWGSATGGRTISPEGQFARIWTGGDHTCGIRLDGENVCWGLITWGN
jgi:alpha-tubulin suppressor-like RCC1 family protein